jgi:membrane-associated phospholipid phosphatase
MFEIIDKIGFLGPIILFFITTYNLLNQKKYLFSYFIFFIANTLVNKILKNIIKEKRPENGIKIMNENYAGLEKYGMPSGHAQSSFFSISFLCFVKGFSITTIFELFIAGLTLFQRWKYKNHTLEQLLVGSIFGMVFAYISFNITKLYLSSKHFI